MWDRLFKIFLRKSFKRGSLKVTLNDGSTVHLGDGSGDLVEVTLHDDDPPRKVLMNPDLAIGEAYMHGTMTIKNDDLYGFLSLAILNLGRNGERFSNPTSGQKFMQSARKILRKISLHNPVGPAQANVAHHYDLSDQLYDLGSSPLC